MKPAELNVTIESLKRVRDRKVINYMCGEPRKAYMFVTHQAANTLIEKMKQGDKEE